MTNQDDYLALCMKMRNKKHTEATWNLVIEDMRKRNEFGKNKYGVYLSLTSSSSLDMLQHAYEEALDLAVYLKQEIIKREQVALQNKQEKWEENNERMDIIGQNGNDGLHYNE